MVRTLDFHCRGLASIPDQETKILQAVWCSQRKKKFSSLLEHIIPMSPVLVPVTAVNYALEESFKIKERTEGLNLARLEFKAL